MSSLSWLGTSLCPPDCLVKSDIKAPSCAAIFRLGIVVLQCVRAGKVFCGLHVAHVHIICPVRDVIHVRKCTRPSPALPYCKRREAGRGPGNEATSFWCVNGKVTFSHHEVFPGKPCDSVVHPIRIGHTSSHLQHK